MRQLQITRQVTNRESWSFDKYLQEIAKLDVISAEQEVELARRIKDGDKNALEILIKSNLRFVVSVAKKYQNRGLSLPDLVNEGNLGLIEAAKRYDDTRGFKFISFAVWWIRQAISKAVVERARLVRLPLHRINDISRINRVSFGLEQQHERAPAPSEIAALLEVTPDVVCYTLMISSPALSFDSTFSDQENCMYDITPDSDSLCPETKLMNSSLGEDMERVISTLGHVHADIMRHLFGLNGLRPHTLEEIGLKFNLSRERIRQIKEISLRKMRNDKCINVLKDYL